MNVYTYYEPLKQRHHWGRKEDWWQAHIDLWKQTWSAAGWTPLVLGLSEAQPHPRFHELNRKARRFPTINPTEYELACWRRWCAYNLIGPCWVADFDVLNFGWAPRPVPADLTCTQQSSVGWAGCVTGGTFDGIVDWICDEEPPIVISQDRRAHTSDMVLFNRRHAADFRYLGDERLINDPGWERASLVHFCSERCGPDRLKIMQQEIARRGAPPASPH